MENNSQTINNIRVFISSTFQDMQGERDQLITKVFPKLREIASKRNVTLTEIDLRWGITQEESQSSEVVEICMDEIQNSYPFFIGILGNRYGWCPTKEELMKNNTLSDRYGWIVSDLEKGLSITEIEMQYAVLRSQDRVYASFYILNNEQDKDAADKRQQNLKTTIRNNGKYPVYNYSTAEELGGQVEQELMKLLDEIVPQEEQVSIAQQERNLQQAYINDKTIRYIPNPAYLCHLNNFLTTDNCPYQVVAAESGMGKSSLLAFWTKEIQEENKWNIITYFSTNSSFESTPAEILQKLAAEIDLLYQLTDLTDADQRIENESPRDKIQQKRLEIRLRMIEGQKPMLIILDGVNQFADEDKKTKLMNWLPQFPENVKIVFSTTETDPSMQTFLRRNYPVMKVYPLLVDQRKELITVFFAQYRKHLSSKQLTIILNARNITENTMVLISLLEELRCFGYFDKLGEFIEETTAFTEHQSFFNHLLQRKENSYNPSLVENLLTLISLSKDGLTETELIRISGIPSLYWSQFYCANKLHFVLKNGRITFAHDLIARAVQNRYLSCGEQTERAEQFRLRIISYFEQDGFTSSRKSSEYPYQLYQTQNWDKLFNYISSLDYLKQQIDLEHLTDFILYWRTLMEIDDINYNITVYINQITDLKGDDSDTPDVEMDGMIRRVYWQIFQNYFHHLVKICINYLDRTDDAYEFAQFLLKMCELDPKDNYAQQKSSCYNILGVISLKKKNFMQAILEFREALKLKLELYGENNIEITTALFNIGEVYNCMGEAQDDSVSDHFLKAKTIFHKVLEIRQEKLGEMHSEVAVVYANLGSVYKSLHDMQSADYYSTRSRDIYISLYGETHIDVAIEYHNYALRALEDSEYETARNYTQKALAVYRNLLGENNPQTNEEYLTLAIIEFQDGQYESAINYMEQVIRIYERTNSRDNILAGHINTLATYYLANNNLDTARERELECLAMLRELGEIPGILSTTVYDNLGKIYLLLNNERESIDHYRQAIEMWEQLENRERQAHSNSYLGVALSSFSQLEESLSAFDQCLKLLAECGMEKSKAATFANNNTGIIYYKLGNTQKALEYISRAYTLGLEIFGEQSHIVHQYKEACAMLQDQLNENVSNHGKGKRLKNATTASKPDELKEELDEFNSYTNDNTELDNLFCQAREAFNACNVEKAIDLFELALYTCDKYEINSDSLARAILLRYLAFSYEIGKKTEKAEYTYSDAVKIATDNDNHAIAQRILKDMAEFNWNRGDFMLAEHTYWQEFGHALTLHGFYHNTTLSCLNNAVCAMTKQEACSWETVLACSDLAHYFTDKTEGLDELNKNASDFINWALNELEESDPSIAEETHIIDRDKAIIILIDYLNDLELYMTADKIIQTYLNSISSQEGVSPDTFCLLYHRMMCMMQINDNYFDIINIAIWLREHVQEYSISNETQCELDSTLANAYMETLQYDMAEPLIEQLVEKYNKGTLLLAECYRASGRIEEALVLLETFTKKHPNANSIDYFLLVYSKTLLDNNEPEKVLDYLQKYIQTNSYTDCVGEIQMAYAFYQLGREMEALEITHTVIEKLNDWKNTALKRLIAHITLTFYMLKVNNLHHAAQLNNELKELISQIPEELQHHFLAQANLIDQKIALINA